MQVLIDSGDLLMSDDVFASIDPYEAGGCVSYRLRRAARTAAKLFDRALKPVGLRNTQFTLLASLSFNGEISIGDMSDELAIDATTLNRNLEVLIRRGLVENIEAEDGRVRNLRWTAAGKTAFAEALPLWRQAQKQALGGLGAAHWVEIREDLREIESACEVPAP